MTATITPTHVSTHGRLTVSLGVVDPETQLWEMSNEQPARMDIRMSPNIFKNNHNVLSTHSDTEIQEALVICFREWFDGVILDHGQNEVFLADDLAAMKTFLRKKLLEYVESTLLYDVLVSLDEKESAQELTGASPVSYSINTHLLPRGVGLLRG